MYILCGVCRTFQYVFIDIPQIPRATRSFNAKTLKTVDVTLSHFNLSILLSNILIISLIITDYDKEIQNILTLNILTSDVKILLRFLEC